MYKFIKSVYKSQATEQDINDLEKKWNICFPKLLKEYYMKYDNSKIYICRIIVDGFEHELSGILPIQGTGYSLNQAINNDRLDELISEEYTPFAYNRGGDYYYWNSTDEGIYVIYCDDIESYIHICDGFETFFSIMEAGVVIE